MAPIAYPPSNEHTSVGYSQYAKKRLAFQERGMSRLPKAAQSYIVGICLAGLALLAFPGPRISRSGVAWWELGLFLVLAALAGGEKFRLVRNKQTEEVVSFSIGFSITFAAMLHFGPAGCLVVGAMSCASSCVYPFRQPLYQ